MPSSWKSSVELCSASQPTSFAYESTVKRWPTILTGVIDELSKLNGHLLQPQDEGKLKESKVLINDIAGLIYEMRHDRELPDIDASAGLPNDAKVYNNVLATARAEGKPIKWFNASWLYAECYMQVQSYRRLRAMFSSTEHWRSFDCFASQKLGAFRSSATGIYALARSVQDLVKKGQPSEQELHADFIKMLEICLWGNATDLSLLTSLTHEDIQALQSVERGANFVLKNDFAKVWQHVKTLDKKRIDIVLDNSGFELYSDLVLGDWLLTLSPFCSEIVFHPKLIPWFVSDVQPHDFKVLLSSLLDPSFFPSDSGASDEDRQALNAMVERWQSYVDKGVFRLSTPLDLEMGAPGGEIADFWTGPQAFADLPSEAPELLRELKKASLVIFKGDLNYRKMTYDACWPTITSFEDTLGPLKGEFDILSLRTCKADVCVGLEEGKAEELDRTDPSWRVSGKYAVVSFVQRCQRA